MLPPANPESRLRVALGTFVSVDAEAEDRGIARQALAAAFEAITQVERLMHPTRGGSDLAALSASAPGRGVQVHAWTFEVLELCKRLHEMTKGAFDPCLPCATGSLSDLELVGHRYVIAHAPVRIDLGGVAKGFAVDRGIAELQRLGCHGGLVNAGGDLAVFGTTRREITCRADGGIAMRVDLLDCALATSDARTALSERPAEHRGYYHGTRGGSVPSGIATILAPSAALADALTKCVLLGTPVANERLLEACNARQLHHSFPGRGLNRSESDTHAQVEP